MAGFFDVIDRTMNAWAAGLGWPLEALLRLALAAVAGGLIGMEREVRGRHAGFRTNLLVCLGSALVMIVSISFAAPGRWDPGSRFNVNVDPARLAYGVMAGIGFLGAGTIIQARGSVRGLTTAAALWCVAAVGLAAGFGLYVIGMLATGLIFLSLWLLDYLEEAIPRREHHLLTIRRPWAPGCVNETDAALRNLGCGVGTMSFRRSADLREVELQFRISSRRSADIAPLLRALEEDHKLTVVDFQED